MEPTHPTWSGERSPVNWNSSLEHKCSGQNCAGLRMPRALCTSTTSSCAASASASCSPMEEKPTYPGSARYARENLAGTMHAGSARRNAIWRWSGPIIAFLIQQRSQTGARCSLQLVRRRTRETYALCCCMKRHYSSYLHNQWWKHQAGNTSHKSGLLLDVFAVPEGNLSNSAVSKVLRPSASLVARVDEHSPSDVLKKPYTSQNHKELGSITPPSSMPLM